MLPGITTSQSISLLPFSGIQFLDFGINIHESRFFASYCVQSEMGKDSLSITTEDEESGKILDEKGNVVSDDDELRMNPSQVLDVFDRCWLPLPMLRVRETTSSGKILFDEGPENWVRFRLAVLDEADSDGNTHRVTIAVDTNLHKQYANRDYSAPSPTNVTTASQFALASRLNDIDWLYRQEWSRSVIDSAYDSFLLKRFGSKQFEARKSSVKTLEIWAAYVTIIGLFAEQELFPPIRFIDSISEPKQYNPINVDLVLDMGNSRTCGILIESSGNGQVDLNNSYSLELRDLSEAEKVYRGPFPSRIEFHKEDFGNNRLTMRSRGDAFQWPTPVRIGWEAQRLSSYSKGTDGNTGLSSPKRYLWDTRSQMHEWYFNNYGERDSVYCTPAIMGMFFKHLTNDGDEWIKEDVESACVTRANYTRSSMMMFYLSEVFSQALSQINSYGQRRKKAHTDIPRRLKRIILTMPTAMTLSERRIFEKRAKLSLDIIMKVMKFPEDLYPELIMQWDEATGTQTVFLYNEIKENFRGDAQQFFGAGAKKTSPSRGNKIRIASLDIGGGTSDLIITTYELFDGRALAPTQDFREGFNIAGDDVLRSIIERHVLPSVKNHLDQGLEKNSDTLMSSLFGASRADEDEREHQKRLQFAHQYSIPVALRIIGLYEHYDPSQGNSAYTLKYQDIFSDRTKPHSFVEEYIETAVHDAGAADFKLEDIIFNIDLDAVDNTVKRTLGPLLSDMCELINHYSCDYLLVSGRTSMMPGVKNSIVSKIPVPIDRIISMHSYKVGDWYPFRDLQGYLSDPKTTASVGALVCALSTGFLVGFYLNSQEMIMKSTANFIGMLEDTGQVKNQNLYFKDLNFDSAVNAFQKAPKENNLTTDFSFSGPMFIGFRQLSVERWPGSPLFRVDFKEPEKAGKLALPLKITIGLIPSDQDKHCKIFDIQAVQDSNGQPLSNSKVQFRLQTMINDNGHWMDTGVFIV